MRKIFFIADTHFGSDAVRRYENRPFATVEEMDRVMTERWNSVVSPDDEVWHLGDFGAEGATTRTQTKRTAVRAFARFMTCPCCLRSFLSCHITRSM